MLNMGFKEDIDGILAHTPKEKRTWLFSATMPKGVAKIAKSYMEDPIEVTIGSKNIELKIFIMFVFMSMNESATKP